MEQQQNYHSVGRGANIDSKDWVWSNSALSTIIPRLGGHPKKALKFFSEENEIKNLSLERGTLLHDYMEHPDTFAISEVIKPSEKLGDVTDKLVEYLQSSKRVDDTFFFTDEIFHEKLYEYCQELGYQKKWGKEAIVKNYAALVRPYLDAVIANEGKHILTKTTGDIVKNCIESITKNERIKAFLDLEKGDGIEVYKELEIYFEYEGIKMKSKLDRLAINFNSKVCIITDYKTTGSDLLTFNNTFEKFNYYRQMGVYILATREYLIQLGLNPNEFYIDFQFIVVETHGLFLSDVFRIPMQIKVRYFDVAMYDLILASYYINFYNNVKDKEVLNDRWENLETNFYEELKSKTIPALIFPPNQTLLNGFNYSAQCNSDNFMPMHDRAIKLVEEVADNNFTAKEEPKQEENKEESGKVIPLKFDNVGEA
jgi:hypothetical protein